MREFAGRVAVVTGGASGIGRALGERFLREGMKVVLADVEKAALDASVDRLSEKGQDVSGIVCDVASQESVQALARQVFDAHPTVHVLCNNAGIGTDETKTMIWDSMGNDWTWAFRVNVFGVVHGIRAFVPTMLARGEEGHVVNTSSGNGGLYPLPTTPIYAATKAAVTTISEVLHYQLMMARAKIKASVLYPGPHMVNTNIFTAARNRPAELPLEKDLGPPPSLEEIRKMIEGAGGAFRLTEPEEVAECALEGIRNERFWILPPSSHTDAGVRARLESILERKNPTPRF
jgi:NAD(P)-dependent dehydrogenase (short-subunit alcohol dehydrogenase family)